MPKEEISPEQIVSLVEEMYNGATTRVRTECGVSAELPVSGVTLGVSTEPFQRQKVSYIEEWWNGRKSLKIKAHEKLE